MVRLDLGALAGEFWDITMEASPTTATLLGDHRFDSRIEDLSEAADAARRARMASIHERLAAMAAEDLDRSEQVTLGLLRRETEDTIALIDQKVIELQSDQMQGIHVGLLQSMPLLSAPAPEHAVALLDRLRQVPVVLDQAMDRFRAGVAAGRTPARVSIVRSINVVDGYLASPPAGDAFASIRGPGEWAGEDAWRAEMAAIASQLIRPAFGRLRDAMAENLLPVARPDDRCGLCWLEDGAAIYATLSRHHTTLELSAQEIHAIGMEEVTEALPRAYADVGGRLFATSDVAAVLDRLRRDRSLRYTNGTEILADAHRAIDAATAAMGGWFGRLPQASCGVEAVPDFLAADAPTAYYFPPAGDGSREGTYFVNTSEPGRRGRFESASITFHEAIPGHHLQLAIASEMTDLPAFQRFSLSNTAYVEGWALYAERLAEEMGLYRGDLDRLGMLSADSLRACRLVLDTGLHALGWSRQQAIEFMSTHTPSSVDDATVEVDRYIAMPGQALAYKLGQRQILRLRESAENRLAGRFDVRGFHDMVLGSGAVSLPVLAGLVEDWVAAGGG